MSKKSPSRMTVVETLYHAPPHEQPVGTEHRFGRLLATDEQPFVRKFTVTEKWAWLPCGWFVEGDGLVGMLHITNDEGKDRTVNPTERERAESEGKVIELAVCDPAACENQTHGYTPFALVRPRESCRFEPCGISRIALRCRGGETKATLTLIPA